VFGIAAAAAACDRPGPDEALYLSAHDAGIAHEDAEAHQLYRRLLRDHPNSRFKPDAHLALAELFFRRGELAAARAEYDEVLKFPEAKS
jgi:TolA-binding protein